MPIRVFIYDNHGDRRDSLKALLSLQNEYVFVSEAENCLNANEDMKNVILMLC